MLKEGNASLSPRATRLNGPERLPSAAGLQAARARKLLAGLLALIGAGVASAEHPLTSNARAAIDLAGRYSTAISEPEDNGTLFLGVDALKVLQGARGDLGRITVQLYMTKLVGADAIPGPFDGEDDAELIFRNVHADFRVLPGRALAFRVGHFEVPFGLEYVIETNGTLHQITSGPNLGVKGDWGVAGHGIVGDFEYEVALQRGGGNSWKTNDSPYIASGRLGTRRDRRLSGGISVLDGAVHSYKRPLEPVERSRLGVDLRWISGRYELLGEYSFGETDGQDTSLAFVELDFLARDGAWIAYSQYRHSTSERVDGTERTSSLTLGWRFEPNNDLAFSLQYARPIHTKNASGPDGSLSLQVRRRIRY